MKRVSSLDIVIFRYNAQQQLAESCPCRNCLTKLKKYSNIINKVYYSRSDGTMSRRYLDDMVIEESYISSGHARILRIRMKIKKSNKYSSNYNRKLRIRILLKEFG